jgi:poly-gamma-glutamate synthesis protein (capsule biosynthesis protein)
MLAPAAAALLLLCACWSCEREGGIQVPPERPAATRQERPVRIMAVGDTLLADAAQRHLDCHSYDYPFEKLGDLVKGHDLLVGNYEGTITEQGRPASRRVAKALKDVGFDLMCLANNHALDFGRTGLYDTEDALEAVGIRHFGAGRDLEEAVRGEVVEVADLRIGFLGFMQVWRRYDRDYHFYAGGDAPGVAPLREEVLRDAIYAMRPDVHTLVVSIHWGKNYADATSKQVEWGKLAVKLGADLVIGHGSHTVQGVAVHDRVPVLYSLGNFTFGTSGRFKKMEKLWHHGWIADVTIDTGRVSRVDLIPIEVNNKVVEFQPRLADPTLLPPMLKLINSRFGTEMDVLGDRARLDL